MKWRVYDSRTDDVLFQSDNKIECLTYMTENFDDYSEDFNYIWIGENQ